MESSTQAILNSTQPVPINKFTEAFNENFYKDEIQTCKDFLTAFDSKLKSGLVVD